MENTPDETPGSWKPIGIIVGQGLLIGAAYLATGALLLDFWPGVTPDAVVEALAVGILAVVIERTLRTLWKKFGLVDDS